MEANGIITRNASDETFGHDRNIYDTAIELETDFFNEHINSSLVISIQQRILELFWDSGDISRFQSLYWPTNSTFYFFHKPLENISELSGVRRLWSPKTAFKNLECQCFQDYARLNLSLNLGFWIIQYIFHSILNILWTQNEYARGVQYHITCTFSEYPSKFYLVEMTTPVVMFYRFFHIHSDRFWNQSTWFSPLEFEYIVAVGWIYVNFINYLVLAMDDAVSVLHSNRIWVRKLYLSVMGLSSLCRGCML